MTIRRARQLQHQRRLQPLQAWLLAALLLAAQALGLAHGVVHPSSLPGVVRVQAASEAAAGVDTDSDGGHEAGAAHVTPEAHEAHEAHDATGHAAGSADCRLIDQLAHADALCAGASLRPALPRAAAVVSEVAQPAPPRGSASAYRARGPPASA